ncbi:MAG: DMT family transporter [Rhodospirillaceae bacterium]|jgi:drug/metabolite transporter (DMT)-like permease|nr:DMT family transporter [Rhodospirillaceae bacterium]MBT4940518.1 DMT family transporter [Rhodospirillaceae bacterium]MBT7266905.1 DMT family transporter [Rhodospirillaceae bacterium]
MPSTKILILGFFYASVSTTIGGMTVALTRLIISQSDPLSLAFLRYGLGGLVLAGILYFTRKPPKIIKGDLLAIIALGVVMFAAFPYFMARSLEDTTAARGALLFAAMPLITIMLGAVFKVEKLTATKSVAVLIAMTGTAIALGENIDAIAPNALRGDGFMFLGMASVSVFNVFSKKYLMRYGNLATMTYTLFFGVSFLFVLAIFFGQPFSGSLNFDLNGWFVIFLLAVPGGAVMFLTWGRALQMISPTQAAIATGFNPLTAILLGAWLLSEPVSIRLLGGFLLILLAILIASKSSRQAITPPVNT